MDGEGKQLFERTKTLARRARGLFKGRGGTEAVHLVIEDLDEFVSDIGRNYHDAKNADIKAGKDKYRAW
eukprot:587197-Karenia_brevis.AAC.1